jgi:hypothetical protein
MPTLHARLLDASFQQQIVIAHDAVDPFYIDRGQ